MAEKKNHNKFVISSSMNPLVVIYFQTNNVYFIHEMDTEKLTQCVAQQVNLALYHSDQFITGVNDSDLIKDQPAEKTTCTAPTSSWQTHKGSDTWSRKKAGASSLKPMTSLWVLPECLGLQPNLGRVGGREMDDQKDQPATELLH